MNSCSGSGSAAVVPNCYQSTFFLSRLPAKKKKKNIVFSYSERIPVSFSWLFHSFSFFFFLLFYVLINFYKNYVIIIILLYFFFMKIIFIFSCSGMFRNVPCSGFYRRPMRAHRNQRILINIYLKSKVSPNKKSWSCFHNCRQIIMARTAYVRYTKVAIRKGCYVRK